MANPSLLAGLFITLLATTLLPEKAQSQDEVKWAKRIETGKEVITTLQFYFHDVVSGDSPTAIKIAQASNGTSLSLFGNLLMVDDALTVGPDPKSKVIGRARGMYGSASQSVLDMGLIMVMGYVFTDGIYDGSSFSLLSINPALHRVREMAIVGGTGLFRLARGYAIAQTYWFDTSGDAIVHYNLLIMITLMSTTSMPCAQAQNESWARRTDTRNEVVTTLQFYFHDILSGRNPTAVQIVPPSRSSTTSFGLLNMVDDPLTIGPDPNSKLVGRARGMYGSAGQTDFGLIMVMSFVFTDGIYDGSSFSLLSINPAGDPVREMAIVGGTGLFRLARGYAIATTYSFDGNTGDAVVGYNVTLATYI
ncbi:hypothetical protein M9H77_33876 [Catharanthus roseus]|uniref:Uncharacterized protein n=1 Tax=Catharanthus roseus TaxID=4058 RepID=A0ACB9ZJK6_CATRO|nr:hypothetical protein M9H77_33876 [Catharanthus roseus]